MKPKYRIKRVSAYCEVLDDIETEYYVQEQVKILWIFSVWDSVYRSLTLEEAQLRKEQLSSGAFIDPTNFYEEEIIY